MSTTLIVNGYKKCRKCLETKDLIHFHQRDSARDGYRNECKLCFALKTKEWRQANFGKAKETQRKHYQNNKDLVKRKVKEYREKNWFKIKFKDAEKRSKLDKTIVNQRSKKYRKNNPKKVLALSHLYRNKKASKIGLYYIKKTKELYKNCPIGMEVDHIVPISSDFVSGLHVPWNLQYLSIKENRVKSNLFDGTYENVSWRLKCL